MLLGGLALCGLAAAEDLPGTAQALAHVAQSPSALAGALYVSLLGGALSYAVFYSLASSSDNLTRLSSLTFLTPVRRRPGGSPRCCLAWGKGPPGSLRWRQTPPPRPSGCCIAHRALCCSPRPCGARRCLPPQRGTCSWTRC